MIPRGGGAHTHPAHWALGTHPLKNISDLDEVPVEPPKAVEDGEEDEAQHHPPGGGKRSMAGGMRGR